MKQKTPVKLTALKAELRRVKSLRHARDALLTEVEAIKRGHEKNTADWKRHITERDEKISLLEAEINKKRAPVTIITGGRRVTVE